MMQNNDILATKDNCYILCNICASPISQCDTENEELKCSKCGHKNSIKRKDSTKTLGFALSALIMYIPANLLPFMTFEMYGNKTTATIWSGIVSLAESGSWALAVIVFVASMLVPFIKLVALFYLSLSAKNGKNQVFKTKLYHFIEVIGPWSMLDVFLLAVLVAVVKLDAMATVSVGEGSLMFLFVVIFTIVSSSSFDPKIIWEEEALDEN